jgi:hypothetical protein
MDGFLWVQPYLRGKVREGRLLRPYRAGVFEGFLDPGRCPLAVRPGHGIGAHNPLGPRTELCARLRAGWAKLLRPFGA